MSSHTDERSGCTDDDDTSRADRPAARAVEAQPHSQQVEAPMTTDPHTPSTPDAQQQMAPTTGGQPMPEQFKQGPLTGRTLHSLATVDVEL